MFDQGDGVRVGRDPPHFRTRRIADKGFVRLEFQIVREHAGFADIHIKALNGDRFPPGKRIYFNGVLKFSPEFSLITQFTEGVGFIAPTVPRTRVDVILSYNILESLKRTKLF